MTPNESSRAESVRPPAWAESVLRLMLTPVDAETVSGDLIEEYREAVYPARGPRMADVWFLRQVAGFVWRAVFVSALILFGFIAGRFLLDTFAPPANWSWRSAFTTWSSIILYLVAAVWGARRTGHARTGILVAIGTHLVGWSLSIAATAALFAGVIRHQPAMLRLFQQTGGWGEQWGIPLLLLPLVVAIGSVGGALGKFLGSSPGVTLSAPDSD